MSRFSATDDLLTRGVAAARDQDREQARFYLEWVLREDPTTQQAQEAWYWLSRLADDRSEQRRCLEQVLSLWPLHPDARRDLAILDGRLNPAEMIDPNRPLAPLASAPTGEVAGATQRCPRCGGGIRFSPIHQALACSFCGYKGDDQPGAAVDERDWFAAAFTARGHRWVLATVPVLRCQGCGAIHTLPAGQVSGACPFCASPQLVPAQAAADLVAPDGIVPFAFDADTARAALRDWHVRHRSARRATVSAPRPIYLPFWTFDIEAIVRWRREVDEGDTRFVLIGQVQTRPAMSGEAPLSFDDVLVPATNSLPAPLLAALDFDTSAPLPFANDVLTGWPAELYAVPVTTASLTARERARGLCERRLAGLDDGEPGELVITGTELSVATYKLLLVPVWVATLHQGEQTRLVAVNGQSGEVQDGEPRRWQRFVNWLTG